MFHESESSTQSYSNAAIEFITIEVISSCSCLSSRYHQYHTISYRQVLIGQVYGPTSFSFWLSVGACCAAVRVSAM